MPLAVGRIAAVQVGAVKIYDAPTRADQRSGAWASGIAKSTLDVPVMVRFEGIDGDAQADLAVHGGPDGAVMAFAADSYPAWERDLGRPISFGGFGENLTVIGFDDSNVCLGDIWEVGEPGGLMMQVTQPRQPCYKLARRLDEPRIVKWITERCNGGWYFRVLREGPVAARMEIRQTERGHAAWPMCEAVRVMYARARESDAAARLHAVGALSERWRAMLASA